jgi:hypothetical protein
MRSSFDSLSLSAHCQLSVRTHPSTFAGFALQKPRHFQFEKNGIFHFSYCSSLLYSTVHFDPIIQIVSESFLLLFWLEPGTVAVRRSRGARDARCPNCHTIPFPLVTAESPAGQVPVTVLCSTVSGFRL